MLKYVTASLVLVLSVVVASADEFVGHITKFEDGKMTVQKSKGTKATEEITLKFDDNVKIVRIKINKDTQKIEAGEVVEGGKEALSKQVKEHAENVKKWTKEGKKGFGPGVFASIVTDGDKATELRVNVGGKKKEVKKNGK